jgi:hypothetical protein
MVVCGMRGGGTRSWGKRHQALSAVPSGRASGGPLLIIFTLGLPIPTYCYVKMTTRTSTALRDDLGWDKSPENPQLEQRCECRIPPAGGSGWDCFLLTRSVTQGHKLSAFCRPDVHYDGNLVEETRGERKMTRVVRVLRVGTNTQHLWADPALAHGSEGPHHWIHCSLLIAPEETNVCCI